MARGVKYATEEERRAALRESRQRYDRTAKGRAKYARYRETDGYLAAQERSKPGKAVTAAAHRRKVKADWPDVLAAWNAVSVALETGRLTKPSTCQSCGRDVRLDGHHHRGYAEEYRLDVLWLCRRCHKAAHRKGVISDG